MSWEIFKQNILRLADNPETIKDIDIVAKTFAIEYDSAVKRGADVLHKVSVKKGNVEAMEALFKAALLKGVSSTTPYDLVGEMGKGVLAYWSGAVLNEFPIPIIPAVGSVSNVSVTSNTVTNPGNWAPAIVIPSTPGGVDFKLNPEQIQSAKAEVEDAKKLKKEYEEENTEEGVLKGETADEIVDYQEERIDTEEDASTPDDEGDTEEWQAKLKEEPNEIPEDSDIGIKIRFNAIKDIGQLENPLPPSKPANSGNYVLGLLRGTGINGPAFWCAAAVSSWYKKAGAKSPNSASCDSWMAWGKRNGLFSSKPVVGAAVLYGSSVKAHHIGIVESISSDGRVKTIEGNTSGGGFNRDGVGVFRKTANPKRVVGYVHPRKK